MIPAPQREPGKYKALLLTLLVHVVLIGALILGVQWKQQQQVAEVELWSEIPHAAEHAAPPPPPPQAVEAPKPQPKVEPPPPKVEPKPVVKPDIAIKDEKKKPEPKKPEPPKPEPPKPQPAKPEPPKQETPKPAQADNKPRAFDELLRRNDAQLQARQSADNMARLQGMADAERKAAGQKSGLADYAAKIRGKVRGNIVLPPGIQGNPEAIFEVTQLPTGEVISVRLKSSSGNQALDAAIERAINKSSPLPKPADPSLFQRVIEIKYRPVEE